MVGKVKKHSWGLFTLLGILFLLGGATGFWGKQVIAPNPIPYTFDLDTAQTGWREDGYHLAGIVHKRECERLPAPAGFAVEVTAAANAEPYRAEWRSLIGRPINESRPEGSASLHILIDLPPAFSVARVWTAHACPAMNEGTVVMVRTLLHEIAGNVIEQRVLSSEEIAK